MLSPIVDIHIHLKLQFTAPIRPPPVHSYNHLLGSNERQENVEGDLDRVEEKKTVLVGDELEVHGVHDGPDLPRSLASREKVGLDLGSNGTEGVSVDQSQISEEDRHEDGAPTDLVDSNLEGNVLGFLSADLIVKPVVEVVTRGTVVDETKERERQETLHVERSCTDEDLRNKQKQKQKRLRNRT